MLIRANQLKQEEEFQEKKIRTVIKTIVDGREYILTEEAVVKERTFTRKVKQPEGTIVEKEVTEPDMVVTNDRSTSNEQYVVNASTFDDKYELSADSTEEELRFTPVYELRPFARVDENVVITTAWGAPAVCLAGSYIVTYNPAENDYNTVEQAAYRSTYTPESIKTKRK